MDFEAEMRQAIAEVEKGQAARPVRVKAVDGLIARPDGNNVSMEREGLNLAEAQLKFKTGVALLREEYQRVLCFRWTGTDALEVGIVDYH